MNRNRMDNALPLVFGLHMPKCAGTTLLERVKSCLKANEIYQSTSIIQNLNNGSPEFLYIKNYDEIKFVFGHVVHEQMLRFLKRKPFLFTGVREPSVRILSEINYLGNLRRAQGLEPLVLSEYFAQNKNPQCNYLVRSFPTFAGTDGTLSERAIRALGYFSAVYSSDNFEETARVIFDQLGISPDSRNHNRGVYAETRSDIADAVLDADYELYNYALSFKGRSQAKTEQLMDFISGEPEMTALRNHIFDACFWEYKNWKKLSDVIGDKEKLIENLTEEVALYKRREF